MRILVAPDSFKGSLSALQAAEAMTKAILKIYPDYQVSLKPMADGGEGTLDCMLASSKGEKIPFVCKGPLGTNIDTHYAVIDGQTAIIESALICGLVQVPEDERNPDNTTSYGIGEAMIDALNKGCTNIIIGIGGSSTNDGGLGMLQALGVQALDHNGQPAGIFGKDLFHVSTIDLTNVDQRLKQVSIQIACDVDNPLCGDKGASAVYGPQKGATPTQIKQYDAALADFSEKITAITGEAHQNKKGAGAAGGLGFAFLTIGAEIISGAKLIGESIQLEEAITAADLVITGEGRSDEQTLYGKAPGYIANLAAQYNKPVILLSGSITGNTASLREKFTGCFSIMNELMTLEECMDNAETLLQEQTKQVVHFFTKIHRDG